VQVLVNVFQSVLLTAEHDHLKNFYMIGTYLMRHVVRKSSRFVFENVSTRKIGVEPHVEVVK
jgi:hypothetical protein